MITIERQQCVDSAAEDVVSGSKYHGYSLAESFDDWVNESEVPAWLSLLVSEKLGLQIKG